MVAAAASAGQTWKDFAPNGARSGRSVRSDSRVERSIVAAPSSSRARRRRVPTQMATTRGRVWLTDRLRHVRLRALYVSAKAGGAVAWRDVFLAAGRLYEQPRSPPGISRPSRVDVPQRLEREARSSGRPAVRIRVKHGPPGSSWPVCPSIVVAAGGELERSGLESCHVLRGVHLATRLVACAAGHRPARFEDHRSRVLEHQRREGAPVPRLSCTADAATCAWRSSQATRSCSLVEGLFTSGSRSVPARAAR